MRFRFLFRCHNYFTNRLHNQIRPIEMDHMPTLFGGDQFARAGEGCQLGLLGVPGFIAILRSFQGNQGQVTKRMGATEALPAQGGKFLPPGFGGGRATG